PLGPTGYGDSPYQCFSALAGNPLLLSLEDLSASGRLGRLEFPRHEVDYARVIPWKMAALEIAAKDFRECGGTRQRRQFDEFCDRHAAWLDDFALFMALKGRDPARVWTQWDEPVRRRDEHALKQLRLEFETEIATQKFLQYEFFSQWSALRRYCHERGIRIMGDLPIYLAHDSVDVWVNPQYFQLDERGYPTVVAGVPPDYFSATGQRWGNPIYEWHAMERDG